MLFRSRNLKITVNKKTNGSNLVQSTKPKKKREVQRTLQYVRKEVPKSDVHPMRVDPKPLVKAKTKDSVVIPGLNKSENEYCAGLMNPWIGIDQKIPNVFPIPTKTMTWRGVLNFQSDPQGFARVVIRPFNIANTIATSVGTSAGGPDDDQQLNADIDFSYASMCDVWMSKLPNGQYDSSNLQVQRFRVVSAGAKVTNVTSAVNRSGYITGIHTLEQPTNLTPQEVRALPQSHTANSDQECVIPWVPHDPDCYNFYDYNLTKVGPNVYTELPVTQHFGQWAPGDVRSNCIYYGISGAPNQQFALDYVVNIEYVPGSEFVPLLNPVSDSRGDPNRAVLAMAQVAPQTNAWDSLISVGGNIAIRALQGLGNMAVSALV